ncbi:MAG: TetR/AcrR family transcriptional regulator [Actinomycetota bacterium]|nr:TetR/AcrR family transcriptional regulator [Actinomycetota bacterium]
MEHKPRTQADRTAATRGALVAAARELFGTRGFADVGTEEVVRAAGVSRGALYHQFADKTELFAAVFEAVEEDLAGRIGAVVGRTGAGDPLGALGAGVGAWLDACAQPEVQRIVLLDAPAVLGWERFRAIGLRYGVGLVESVLRAGMESGGLVTRPVRPLAHVLIGALDEAGLYVARAPDPAAARADVEATLAALVTGLLASP